MTKYRSVYHTILLSTLVTCTGIRDAAAAAPPAYHFTDLGTLGVGISYALGINASGQVTGASYTTGNAASHAFLYTSGSGMVDLNTLIDPHSGWVLLIGNGINDAGQITGEGVIGGERHAFLLTPVPEPATLVLLALSLPLLVGRNSRQLRTDGARGARRFALAAPTRAAAVPRSGQ